jgi:chloride channel protein, CIC family
VTTRLRAAERRRLREHHVFFALTIVVGILAGLAAVLFTVAIEQAGHRLFGLAPSPLRLFLVPPLVSLLSGVLLAKLFPDARGSGVPQTEAAYHLNDGIIPARVPVGKFITGMLCIGSGHSMGREGPSVQIGAGLASVIGRWMGLPPRSIRDLVPIGAAGALAAAFNTPVAAVLFALEEIIGDMNAALLGSTVVASVASVVVERAILGNEPLFHVPTYHLVHPAELTVYAVLGVAGGAVSLVFCKGLLSARAAFRRLPAWTTPWQPAIGGLAIGAALLYAPAIKGVGYEFVDQALNGGLVLRTLLLLSILKLAATITSYASGNAGGIFAPALYIGAMTGGALGTIVHGLAPFPTGDPGAYALVGMGTLFAGIIRAPITSVFMIFEITQDYQILVPLMIANMLAFMISKHYQPTPVYHALLRQDDVHLPHGETRGSRRAPTARHLMQTDVTWLSPDTRVDDAWLRSADDGSPAYFVGSRDSLVGIVRREQLAACVDGDDGARPVSTLAQPPLTHVHPDHPIEVVLDRLGQSGDLLPVVNRRDARRVEGVVTPESIVSFIHRRRRQPSRTSARVTAASASAEIPPDPPP